MARSREHRTVVRDFAGPSLCFQASRSWRAAVGRANRRDRALPKERERVVKLSAHAKQRALERQIRINAQVLPNAPIGDVADRVKVAIDSLVLPPGYRTVFTGNVQDLNDTKRYVGEALTLAVIFIYLILASLFGSFLQPLSIMLALPLSFLGVALGLLLTKGTINVMSMIGIIMLMGLVTKNGILLIDFVNQRDRKSTRLNSSH